jgi:conjugal transfer mating pair stabilization protein TraN
MGRIIQKEGRDQLQEFAPDGDWGSVGAPNCEGLTPEEFQMLDFSKIDLSEAFGDISPLPADQIQNNVQGAITDFQNKVQ